jgi:hypothetical protein
MNIIKINKINLHGVTAVLRQHREVLRIDVRLNISLEL